MMATKFTNEGMKSLNNIGKEQGITVSQLSNEIDEDFVVLEEALCDYNMEYVG